MKRFNELYESFIVEDKKIDKKLLKLFKNSVTVKTH